MDLRLRKELIAWIIGSVVLLVALCVSDAFISQSEGDVLAIRSPKYYRPPPAPLPVIDVFKAEPKIINEGETATLIWDLQKAKAAYLYPGGENGVEAPGSMVVAPTETTTYKLEACNRQDKCVSKQVTIRVRRKPSISLFIADPPNINQGQSTDLRWSVAEATEVLLDGEAVTATGVKAVSPPSSRDYTLVARNDYGEAQATVTVSVRVRRPPAIRVFEATPGIIELGQITTLHWNISGATEAFLNDEPIDLPEGTKEVQPQDTAVYTLVARNADGENRSELTVNVRPTPTPVPLRIKVVSADGAPVPEAEVYYQWVEADQTKTTLIDQTDEAGELPIAELSFPSQWYAQVIEAERPSPKHEWAYKKYAMSAVQVASGQGELVLTLDKKLVGFNVLVSVEWDADPEYIAQLKKGFAQASEFLYKATNGQVFFEQVTIHDNGSDWKRADFRVHASNEAWPRHAAQFSRDSGFIEDADGYVYLPRYWGPTDEETCCQAKAGPWNEDYGVKTIAKMLGHYGLHMTAESLPHFDEEGNCTVDLCIMNEPWASEFFCEQCWTALQEIFGLKIPERRAKGLAVTTIASPPPPTQFQTAEAENVGQGVSTVDLTIKAELPAGPPLLRPRVKLLRGAGPPLDQGRIELGPGGVDAITLLGASDEYSVHLYSPSRAWDISAQVGQVKTAGLELTADQMVEDPTIRPPLVFPITNPPGLKVVVPVRDMLDSLPQVRVVGHELDFPLEVVFRGKVVIPSQSVSPTAVYEGYVPFPEIKALQGTVEMRALNEAGVERTLFTDFSTQPLRPASAAVLSSDDGYLRLNVPAGAVAQDIQVTIAAARPPQLPAGEWIAVGEVYDVELPEETSRLNTPATLILHYPPQILDYIKPGTLSIRRWDAENLRWEDLQGTVDKESHTVLATIDRPSLYTLMARASVAPIPSPTAPPPSEVEEATPPAEEEEPEVTGEVGEPPSTILYLSVVLICMAVIGLLTLLIVYLSIRRRRSRAAK